jgi:hypothetical protein
MSWVLYPLYWADHPTDWQSTQIPLAYLPLVWVISQGKWAVLPLMPGTSTNSLAVYPGHTGRSTKAWDDLPTWVVHCTPYIVHSMR